MIQPSAKNNGEMMWWCEKVPKKRPVGQMESEEGMLHWVKQLSSSASVSLDMGGVGKWR